jgi:hypothetical protein
MPATPSVRSAQDSTGFRCRLLRSAFDPDFMLPHLFQPCHEAALPLSPTFVPRPQRLLMLLDRQMRVHEAAARLYG